MASLEMVFYPRFLHSGPVKMAHTVDKAIYIDPPAHNLHFPVAYFGGIFAAEHGSWNRDPRAGYEVIYIPTLNGYATGEYDDFLTGFVTKDGQVWGRPVGVTVANDGSLIVVDDGSRSVWRVAYTGTPTTTASAHH
jgi:hypothetical protein